MTMQLPLIDQVKKNPVPWVIGLVAAGLIGVSATTFVASRSNTPKQDIRNLTVSVQQKDITARISASGTVVPTQTVNLSPKTSGRLEDLRVEQGDRVRQGQIIARMESNDLEAERRQVLASLSQARARLSLLQAGTRPEEVGQAEAAVDQARARFREAQMRLNLAQDRSRRNQMLAAEGAISRDRLDEVLNDERTAQASVESAKADVDNRLQQLRQQENGPRTQEIEQAAAQVAEAQARLQGVETRLEDTFIRAPFAGIITQKYATEGAFVTPTTSASATSSATSTSVVALADGLEILAKVPEVDVGQIKVGQTVEIKADAHPDKMFKGVVRLVAPEAVVEQNVTSFQVRVKILTGQNTLKSGMNADVIFLGERLQEALIVPTVAIVTDKGQTGVLVPDPNNQPKFQPVTAGITIGNQTQILEGINAGEPVFVELPQGQKLETVMKGMNQEK